MGKRKTALKKKIPNRHAALMKLRELGDKASTVITTRNGAEVRLNLYKHFLLGIPYVNEEYNNELYRLMKKNLEKRIKKEGD